MKCDSSSHTHVNKDCKCTATETRNVTISVTTRCMFLSASYMPNQHRVVIAMVTLCVSVAAHLQSLLTWAWLPLSYFIGASYHGHRIDSPYR